MKIAVFSSHHYDEEYLNRFNSGHQLTYFSLSLNEYTVALTEGFDAVCCFVNDVMDEMVLRLLHNNGIKLIVMRCTGFNNVDIKTSKALGIPVLRVPAYSPEAVAEHTMAYPYT